MKKALFGAGCFWGVEDSFKKFHPTLKTKVGYCGGKRPNPTYEQVCTGVTGHAEVVLVKFDENKVSFRDLLKHFFTLHDPTQKNRQGPDVGTQYRSVVFFFDTEQQKDAKAEGDAVQLRLGREIATEFVKADHFYPAEEYHQGYFDKNPGHGCAWTP